MTDETARTVLQIPSTADHSRIRTAYLGLVTAVSLDADPERFRRLRAAYELLNRGALGTTDETARARADLSNDPKDAMGRWRLLSCLPYHGTPEAAAVLLEGAEQSDATFFDELLFHFPEKVSSTVLAFLANNAISTTRRLLRADVDAVQGRPDKAIEALGAALNPTTTRMTPGLLNLALRPVFSLYAHAQNGAAQTALDLVRDHAGTTRTHDFAIADELSRVVAWLPLDLVQVAAAAAKRGEIAEARYEARYAVRLLKRRALRRLTKQLKQQAPILSDGFALDLDEDKLRPTGTPNFRVPMYWGASMAFLAIYLTRIIHFFESHYVPPYDESIGLVADEVRADSGFVGEFVLACREPLADACTRYSGDDRGIVTNSAHTLGGQLVVIQRGIAEPR